MLDNPLPNFRRCFECAIEFVSLHYVYLWVVFSACQSALVWPHRYGIIFTMNLSSTKLRYLYLTNFKRLFLDRSCFKFFLLDFMELRSINSSIINWCLYSVKVTAWQLLMTSIALFWFAWIRDNDFANLECTPGNNEDLFTFLTLLCNDLASMACFLYHTEMERFKCSLR